MTVLLQSATGITKCDDYYKERQNRHACDYKVKYVVATSGFFIELCRSRGRREGFQ